MLERWWCLSFSWRLATVTALGAAWRLGYLFAVKWDQSVGVNDAIYYSIQAGLNSEGQWFEDGLSGLPGAEHGPLTALYLTPWSIGSWGAPQQRLAMTVVGIATVALIGLVARRLVVVGRDDVALADRAGLIAAAIAAVYPNLWLNDSVVMSEALAILLTAAGLLVAVRNHHRLSTRAAIGVGVLGGLACLARSELALLVAGWALVAVIAARRRGSSLRPALLLVVAGVLTVAPWTLYNLGRFAEPVLLTTNDGNTLLGANCPIAYYDDVGGWDIRCLGDLDPLDEHGAAIDASQRSVVRREQAVEYVGDHLSRLPVVIAARLGRIVDVYGLESQVRMDVGENKDEWAVWAGIGSFWVLAVGAVAGWRQAARRRWAARWWLAVPVVAVVITTVVFYGAHRIRAPAEPVIVVLAAVWLASRSARHTEER